MTERVQRSAQHAYSRALREKNTSVEPKHVLAALLEQDQGVVPALLTRAGGRRPGVLSPVEDQIARLPRLSGSGEAQPLLRSLRSRMLVAARRAQKLTDDYVVEHVLLAMLDDSGAGKILRDAKVTRDRC